VQLVRKALREAGYPEGEVEEVGVAKLPWIAGAGHAYIIVRHILPNLANTMVVLCTLQVGWAIGVEASLTFLGAGVPPPTPTWGGMIAEGLDSLERAWWLTVVPGIVIAVVDFAFNLVGAWVRDLLDPGLANV
jgi:peptide/nickel transport system permease protein